MDLHGYMPDDILVKLDRMSMAVSLEARSPLLDHRVVEFAARLPFDAKIDGQGQGKRLLRHLLARYVPPALTDRPKQGFTPPTRATLDPGSVSEQDPWLDSKAAALYTANQQLDERLLWTFASWNAHKVGRT
jgi:asparagine synthase (glutamine-hydrolysing)